MVHTSGHGYSGELLFLYNAVRPSNAMPVHGEWRHLRANKDLAVSTGVPEENVVLAQNGVVVDLVDGRARVAGQIPVGQLYVDGMSMGDVDADVLADRAEMREGGLITVSSVIDNRTGRPLEKPRAQARGFADDVKEVLAEVEKLVDETMYDLAGSGENNPYRMAQEVRRRAEKMINQKYKRSPMIVPTIVPMSSESGDVVSDDDVDGTRESL